ncbi:NAD(P)H dehydrogenase (quinone) [Variovorax sp. OK605]|uniref:SDR family oxidoreductase n=1 Tax=Variovorax sp. OK605 TaxID=1855317 RepID=UPI0008EEC079|nr:SDR family oxidoreductase [Variovorax sp. OK605]SFP82331.1 NAD(P)H dehydrogenase (quinone) [Variovorax sp. OK605]
MIAITGANGNLGRLAVQELRDRIPADQIVALVRSPEKALDLLAMGVQVREADYDRPETLVEALEGVEKVLLVSAVVPGKRLGQHKAVIDAAMQVGVRLIAYTSMLRAETSALALAKEHWETEQYLKNSGLEFVLLRNGWYLENDTEALSAALAQGAIIGSSGDGRFSSASRADYAAAAIAVLTQPGHEGKIYELAGDQSFAMHELAAEVSKQAGQAIVYKNLSATDFAAVLRNVGLPEMIVDVVVDASVKAAQGELESASRDLARLIGRSTVSVAEAIRGALQGRLQA